MEEAQEGLKMERPPRNHRRASQAIGGNEREGALLSEGISTTTTNVTGCKLIAQRAGRPTEGIGTNWLAWTNLDL